MCQAAALGRGQQGLDQVEMGLFGGAVVCGEGAQGGVLRHGEDAAIDAHGPGFAGVVGTQLGDEPGREGRAVGGDMGHDGAFGWCRLGVSTHWAKCVA